jgi:hypothetical protein
MAKSSNVPAIQRLLGGAGELGSRLGLDNKWMVQAIKAGCNYAEIFERNLGQGKYPPAEPGALGIGPLEAAVRVADAALHSLATRRWPISATNSFGPSGRPLAPGS